LLSLSETQKREFAQVVYTDGSSQLFKGVAASVKFASNPAKTISKVTHTHGGDRLVIPSPEDLKVGQFYLVEIIGRHYEGGRAVALTFTQSESSKLLPDAMKAIPELSGFNIDAYKRFMTNVIEKYNSAGISLPDVLQEFEAIYSH
jgi:hypothetical protein